LLIGCTIIEISQYLLKLLE